MPVKNAAASVIRQKGSNWDFGEKENIKIKGKPGKV